MEGAGGLAAADHAHDLDLVAVTQRHRLVGGPFEDLAVVLDRDRPGIDSELVEVGQQWRRPLELDPFAVDLQGDHF